MDFLIARQRPILERNIKNQYPIYLYKFNYDLKLNSGEIKFLDFCSNLTKVKNITGLDYSSFKPFINTDYPKNGYLLYTKPLENLSEAF